jgi:hypothetical protein
MNFIVDVDMSGIELMFNACAFVKTGSNYRHTVYLHYLSAVWRQLDCIM